MCGPLPPPGSCRSSHFPRRRPPSTASGNPLPKPPVRRPTSPNPSISPVGQERAPIQTRRAYPPPYLAPRDGTLNSRPPPSPRIILPPPHPRNDPFRRVAAAHLLTFLPLWFGRYRRPAPAISLGPQGRDLARRLRRDPGAPTGRFRDRLRLGRLAAEPEIRDVFICGYPAVLPPMPNRDSRPPAKPSQPINFAAQITPKGPEKTASANHFTTPSRPTSAHHSPCISRALHPPSATHHAPTPRALRPRSLVSICGSLGRLPSAFVSLWFPAVAVPPRRGGLICVICVHLWFPWPLPSTPSRPYATLTMETPHALVEPE